MTDTRRKIVPVEATGAQRIAAFVDENGDAEANPYIPDAYQRMLAAAPDATEDVRLLLEIVYEIKKARLGDGTSDFDLARAILKTIEGTPND